MKLPGGIPLDSYSAVIVGLIQGFLEWLPVSSQGNVALFLLRFCSIAPDTIIDFTISLHLGTLLSAVVFFRHELHEILRRLPHYISRVVVLHRIESEDPTDRLITFLIFSTFSTAVTGLPLYLAVKSFFKQSIAIHYFMFSIGLFLIITGLAQRARPGWKPYNEINTIDSTLMGLSQGIAIIPGISRSAMTAFALIIREYRIEDALFLSFLASIPAIISAVLITAITDSLVMNITSIITAAISGYISINFMLKLARKLDFSKFCIIYGLFIIISSI